jgi:hypothetical protein
MPLGRCLRMWQAPVPRCRASIGTRCHGESTQKKKAPMYRSRPDIFFLVTSLLYSFAHTHTHTLPLLSPQHVWLRAVTR